jgi:hypothetical protein
MAMLNYDVFEAFKSAGIPDEKRAGPPKPFGTGRALRIWPA